MRFEDWRSIFKCTHCEMTKHLNSTIWLYIFDDIDQNSQRLKSRKVSSFTVILFLLWLLCFSLFKCLLLIFDTHTMTFQSVCLLAAIICNKLTCVLFDFLLSVDVTIDVMILKNKNRSCSWYYKTTTTKESFLGCVDLLALIASTNCCFNEFRKIVIWLCFIVLYY